MNKLLILIFTIFCSLANATELKNEKLGYTVSFPTQGSFTNPKHTKIRDGVDLWKSESSELGQEFSFMVIDAPMPGGKTTFEQNAKEWEKGMLKSFTKKISSEFTTLGGEPAFHIITTIETPDIELYFSNWYIQNGQTTYTLTVASIDKENFKNEYSRAFLNSFRLSK